MYEELYRISYQEKSGEEKSKAGLVWNEAVKLKNALDAKNLSSNINLMFTPISFRSAFVPLEEFLTENEKNERTLKYFDHSMELKLHMADVAPLFHAAKNAKTNIYNEIACVVASVENMNAYFSHLPLYLLMIGLSTVFAERVFMVIDGLFYMFKIMPTVRYIISGVLFGFIILVGIVILAFGLPSMFQVKRRLKVTFFQKDQNHINEIVQAKLFSPNKRAFRIKDEKGEIEYEIERTITNGEFTCKDKNQQTLMHARIETAADEAVAGSLNKVADQLTGIQLLSIIYLIKVFLKRNKNKNTVDIFKEELALSKIKYYVIRAPGEKTPLAKFGKGRYSMLEIYQEDLAVEQKRALFLFSLVIAGV